MRSKPFILPLAGLLLVGVAGAALAQSSDPAATGTTGAAPAVDASPDPDTTDVRKGPGSEILTDVLSDLVADGTINQSQRDAIVEALDARRTELQAEREARRELWQTILADGQITQAEIDQLPADSPLRSLDTLLDDGVITQDELRALGGFRGGFGPGGGPGRGHGHGLGPWGAGGAPDASPSTSS